jgi:hypothetical protein
MAVTTNPDKTGKPGPVERVTNMTAGALTNLKTTDRGTFWSDTTSDNITLNLPSAADMKGVTLRFVKYSGSNNFTIGRDGSDTINNAASSYVMTADQQYVELVSDGVDNWLVTAEGTA